MRARNRIALMKAIYALALFVATPLFAAQPQPEIDAGADRFETDLQTPLKRIGTLVPKDSKSVRNPVTLGCETLDRDYADYEKYKSYISPLGIGKIRVQAGWAKCEKRKGVYDFAWLDEIVKHANSQSITVYLQTSYGNPIYEGGGTPYLAGGMPKSPEAKAAWDNWVREMAKRYKGANVEWEMWNEPDISKTSTDDDIVDINVRTARIIKSEMPGAKIAALSLANTGDAKRFRSYMEKFKQADAFGLFAWVSHHGYRYRPEDLDEEVKKLRQILDLYAPQIELRQGELGAPSEPYAGGALGKHGWTELTQAKWDIRRILQDHGNGEQTAVFSMADMHYGKNDAIKKTNTKGLLKTDKKHNVVKIKKAYYAVQNAMSIFPALKNPIAPGRIEADTELSRSIFGYEPEPGKICFLIWFNEAVPTNFNATTPVDVKISGAKFERPVWVDVISGRVFEIPQSSIRQTGGATIITGVPVYDSPALISEASLIDFK